MFVQKSSYSKPPLRSARGVVVDDARNFLVVFEAAGNLWNAPGGICEPNDGFEDVLLRAVKGLEIASISEEEFCTEHPMQNDRLSIVQFKLVQVAGIKPPAVIHPHAYSAYEWPNYLETYTYPMSEDAHSAITHFGEGVLGLV